MSWTDQNVEPNVEKHNTIIHKLVHCDSSTNIYEYAQALLPNWILHVCERYVDEYNMLQTNWINLCTQWKTTPKRILIVSFLPSREEFEKLGHSDSETSRSTYQILATCCNMLTANGFVIRAYTEVTACKSCEQAMLSKTVYDYLSEHKSPLVSGEWNDTCKACREIKKEN